MASRLVVSVSTATTPTSCARAIHSFRRASVRTHSYLERSIFCLRAASSRAAASEIGVRAPFLSCLLSDLACGADANRSPVFAGGAARAMAGAPDTSFASASTCEASISAFSATRRVMVLNSIAFKNAIKFL